jgi:hypothetical protein
MAALGVCRRRKHSAVTIKAMSAAMSAQTPSPVLRWLMIPVRVLLVSFLLSLLAFAVFLFLGIIGLVITAGVRGVHPNMTIAYREIAFPAAVVAGAAALVAAIVMELRRPRQQERDLEEIEKLYRQ